MRWTGVEPGEGWWTVHFHPECYAITQKWDDGDWECMLPGDYDRPAVRMYWPKVCARCGTTFERTSDVSMLNWKKRSYCSAKCGADARWQSVRASIRASKKGGAL